MTDLKTQEFFLTLDRQSYFIKEIKINPLVDAPWLIFLHDSLGSVKQWKQFPERIARQCQLNALLIERAGHGQSSPFQQKRDKNYLHHAAHIELPKILDQLKIKQPIVIGHSDGGTIALLYASKYPTKMVVSIAAHVFNEEITKASIQKVDQQKELLISKLQKYHGAKSSALYEAWRDIWLADEFTSFNIEEDVKSLKAPLLVIQSKDDEYGTMQQVNSILKNISSKIKSTYTPDTGGHHPHLSAPEKIVNVISEFILKNL